jgi:hypothetical protein
MSDHKDVKPDTDGIKPDVDGIKPDTDGIKPEADGITSEADGIKPKADGITSEADGITSEADGITSEATSNTIPHQNDNCFKGVLVEKLTVKDLLEIFSFFQNGTSSDFFEIESLRNELVKNPNASYRLDSLFKIIFLTDAELPPGFSQEDNIYFIIEYEEERRAKDFGKHLVYLGIVMQKYYTSLQKKFVFNIAIIYGPKIKPPNTFNANDDSPESELISYNIASAKINLLYIYLNKTEKDKLFATIQDKIDRGEKLNNYTLFKLLSLPRKDKLDVDLLKKCYDIGTNPSLNTQEGIEQFIYYFVILFFESLNDDQKKIFEKEPVMSQYLQQKNEEYAKAAVQKVEQALQAKNAELQALQAKLQAELKAKLKAKDDELKAKLKAKDDELQNLRAKMQAEMQNTPQTKKAKPQTKKPGD